MAQLLQTKSVFLFLKQVLCFLVEQAEDLKGANRQTRKTKKTVSQVNLHTVFSNFPCLVSYNIFLFFKKVIMNTHTAMIIPQMIVNPNGDSANGIPTEFKFIP